MKAVLSIATAAVLSMDSAVSFQLSTSSGALRGGRAQGRSMRGQVQMQAVAEAVAPAETAHQAPAASGKKERPVFPFTSIVGQEEMKLALILNVIDPKIGGLMCMGERGTGKTTTIRAVADLLPLIDIIRDDPFNSSPTDPDLQGPDSPDLLKSTGIAQKKVPMVDLPLGATEDRVCGTIDIEKALTEGVKAFEPGLLAKANRGILYVDEVNLLDDHLVDVLLDSAASGWNTVEREGISIRHPARFVLVGSGNPEEGELRPQLLDRFGMMAEIYTVKDPELRVQVVQSRQDFDRNPQKYVKEVEGPQGTLRNRILKAQDMLQSEEGVSLPYDLRVKISQVCAMLDVDGLRGDIVTNRAAKAHAAFNGRSDVTVEDIGRVVNLCLRHRLRKDPLQQVDSGERVKEVFEEVFGEDLPTDDEE
uniref:Mg-protoporphyrin IX chelatase n=2 Tax=Chromera velia TaxID=505693 RepID=A0A0G4GCH7_9ALVE|mmetsp:Transcript_4570/g.9168  ORF Transcript_4570/g.9168 Transcript_4570/m.9168 type:complete len:420 (-) Transcript_4570:850-2109(-)|eukprot:Cvel_21235.t1-p1 / transcript=Cvel_21235.t1 / gene=Cvel_21235 / organism=Chromera_velia_CCMP2878 / gene_product=Magnesium-chelatase subunit ChlI, putative / transcript_product=Magnesium-chelatase subunit ChlI, putative / location=Cvel_scaffold1974:29013-32173(-) / protein_length=419 / sequence_SO=supercontig / SO=protein_coding / is_pseudo=false